MRYVHKKVSTPVGKLTLIASERGLATILWQNDRAERVRLNHGSECCDHPILQQAEWQLREYFEGRRKVFDISLDAVGTEFQLRVWRALQNIPYGETRSYLEIAREIGNERAVRAVGAANGKNPISIIVPCHRVIGSSGELTGFAGGLETKQKLLSLEKSRSENGQLALFSCSKIEA